MTLKIQIENQKRSFQQHLILEVETSFLLTYPWQIQLITTVLKKPIMQRDCIFPHLNANVDLHYRTDTDYIIN